MTFKQKLVKAGLSFRKHSPAILTGVGVVGIGATAWLAYKSKDKVEAVVEEIERKNDLEIPINKFEVARDITEAIYLPVTVGMVSISAILLAHKIQSDRIKTLASILVVEQARNIYFEKKYKHKHGEEEYTKFVATEDVEEIEIDKKGKEKITVKQVKKEVDASIGQWYSDSREYASDDHTYNIQYIDSVTQRLQTKLFQRGHLILNEVLEELGFERIRSGALLGWSSADSFDIEKNVMALGDDEMGLMKEDIWVTWTTPRYIFGEVDLNGGRYSI